MRVKAIKPFLFNGQKYVKGDVVEMPEREATYRIAAGFVVLVREETPAPAPRPEA